MTYKLSRTQTSEVEETAQLYFGTSDDNGNGGYCPVNGPFTIPEKRSLPTSERSLAKRGVRIVDTDDGVGTNHQALIEAMINEAKIVLHAIDTRLANAVATSGGYSGINDKGKIIYDPSCIDLCSIHN
jgi:hypothetical protein